MLALLLLLLLLLFTLIVYTYFKAMAYPNGPGNDENEDASDADLINNFTLDMEADELAKA